MSIEDEARALLRRALRDTAPDAERDAAGRAYFGAVYLPPGEDPPAYVGSIDASFRRAVSVAFRGGWHAAREVPAAGRCESCGGPLGGARCPMCDPRPNSADRAAGCTCPDGRDRPVGQWEPAVGCPVHTLRQP